MSEYRFHLQKYRPGSKTACPECGRKACFTRYIDETGEISFPGNVGKCDHINSCGYHYTPKEYFRDNPTVKERLDGHERDVRARPAVRTVPEQEPPISYLPSDWVEQSMRRYDINPLVPVLLQSGGQGGHRQAVPPLQGRHVKDVGRSHSILADRCQRQCAGRQDYGLRCGNRTPHQRAF